MELFVSLRTLSAKLTVSFLFYMDFLFYLLDSAFTLGLLYSLNYGTSTIKLTLSELHFSVCHSWSPDFCSALIVDFVLISNFI